MKKNKFVLILVILSLHILISCSKDDPVPVQDITPNETPYPVSFVKENQVDLAIISTDSAMIYKIDDSQHIFVGFINADKDREIWKLDLSLQIKDKYIIKKGQGPNEAINPFIFGGDTREIFCYDFAYKRLMFWTPGFTHCNMEKRRLWYGEFAWHSFSYYPRKSLLLYLKTNPDNDLRKTLLSLTIMNIKNKQEKDIILYRQKIKYTERDANGQLYFWHAKPIHATWFKDHIYILDLQQYLISKYSATGILKKKVRVAFKSRSFSETQLQKWINETTKSKQRSQYRKYPQGLWPACWLLPLGNGIAVGRRENYEPANPQWIMADYFDLNLQYLGKIKIPLYHKNWNHPYFSQGSLDGYSLVKGNRFFFINEDEDKETNVLNVWQWQDEKR